MENALKMCEKNNVYLKTTLYRLHVQGLTANTKLGRKPILPQKLEKLLVSYLLEMERRFFGMTWTDLKRLAFQLARSNNLPSTFNGDEEMAGKKWLKLFMARNPTLSFRKPESTSIARVRGFNRESVNYFFDLLEEVGIDKFPPHRIYNVDETGVSVVQSRKPEIIALKGKKQVGVLSAAERGALITVVCSMSPAGSFVPPAKKIPPPSAKDGAPAGVTVLVGFKRQFSRIGFETS
ncbi:uncharacterized protein LOC129779099 isoform X2 [Toxorhynchites rutilus septentrionalis]|uniref:uncharacterized protein LOC129779099 isoform X2 n=1 Tax=Toxorhynchites rutilus septentrionalis TaxID=329112 RepID=UPI002479D3BC|nr:uncharacterized protein LOC129779099 isoform X2 [Toxorhynchites rutilus septentrionalis]